jgi:RND family efflux transporter MFP subunit
MKRSPKRAKLLLVGALLVGPLGCKGKPQQAQPTADPAPTQATGSTRSVRVEVAVVKPSTARLSLTRPAEVGAARDANLAAALGGYVESVQVKSGQRVRRGQVIAYVDTATHRARRNQARVEYLAAKREYKRSKKLGTAIPRASLDAAKTRLEAARAALASIQVAAQRAVIAAPFAGTIDKVFVEVGEVSPPGAPVARLLQLHPALVTLSISDRDILSVREGLSATVTTDALAQPVVGTVKRVRRAADTRTRAFEVEVEVPNKKERLLPGMIATVRLNAGMGNKRMVISNDWLVTKPDGIGVFVHRQGVAHYQPVVVDKVVGNRVVLAKGLKANQELVITGHRELAQGDALIVSRRGVCCNQMGRVDFQSAERESAPSNIQ